MDWGCPETWGGVRFDVVRSRPPSDPRRLPTALSHRSAEFLATLKAHVLRTSCSVIYGVVGLYAPIRRQSGMHLRASLHVLLLPSIGELSGCRALVRRLPRVMAVVLMRGALAAGAGGGDGRAVRGTVSGTHSGAGAPPAVHLLRPPPAGRPRRAHPTEQARHPHGWRRKASLPCLVVQIQSKPAHFMQTAFLSAP